jgi:hypothetical protein
MYSQNKHTENIMNKTKYNIDFFLMVLFATCFIFIFITVSFSQTPPVIWNKTYSGPAGKNDFSYACATDASGFLYVTGGSKNSNSSNNHDIITIKYNQSTGDTVWTNRYNGPSNKDEEGAACCIANDGNLIVAGYTDIGTTQIDDQLIIIKYNVSNGAIMWTKIYGSSTGNPIPDEMGHGCISDGANLYVVGIYYDGAQKIMIWKLNASGDTIWTKDYSTSNGDAEANGCAVDNNGNLYVSGYTLQATSYKITLFKYNSSGTLQWIKYSASLDEAASNIMSGCTVQGNNIFVTGLAGDNNNRYGVTLKYTDAGDTVWVKRNDSPSTYDQNHKCKADANGDVYISGTRYNGTNDDWVMLKYKGTDGTLLWTVVFNHPANNSDYAIDCALDNSGGLYATGFVNYNNGNSDIYTVKYQSTIGIKKISSEIPSSFLLSQNYPNPFNPKTIINFQLPMSNYVKLNIYDALGREVATLVNEQLNPGTYEVEWNAGNYPSGTYFYKLQTGSFSETKKMLIVK